MASQWIQRKHIHPASNVGLKPEGAAVRISWDLRLQRGLQPLTLYTLILAICAGASPPVVVL